MYETIIMAGFGGQGIMSMGMLLTYAGMLEGKEVTWMPSYGPEMRGGTANCTVVLSTDPIASPVIKKPHTLIAMNRPSLDKFSPMVRENGLILYNESLIKERPKRKDVVVIGLLANDLAEELGEMRTINMIVLGAYLKLKPIVKKESIEASLKKVLPARRHHLLPINMEAFRKGCSLIEAPLLKESRFKGEKRANIASSVPSS